MRTRTPVSKTLMIQTSTYELLSKLRHPGQSFDGFIQELLTNYTRQMRPENLARLERYRTKPEETPDDLIANALNENQEFERQIAHKEGK